MSFAVWSISITVIAASTNVVTQIRQPEVDGYNAIQVAFGEIEARKVNSPEGGHFAKAGVTPRRHVAEIRTADAASYTVGQELGVDTFAAGEEIDVTGTSKGKGFAGTMKRHGFAGVSASHGAHRNHRKPGSIGACATPGRVFKGVRMAGRMGRDTVTVQNLTVHAVDTETTDARTDSGHPDSVRTLRTAARGRVAERLEEIDRLALTTDMSGRAIADELGLGRTSVCARVSAVRAERTGAARVKSGPRTSDLHADAVGSPA